MDNTENQIAEFKKAFKELLKKYNVEIYAFSQGEGFSSEVIIDLNNKEIIRKNDCISQYDIE